MSLQQLKRDIQELKAAAEVKKALPWDCKSLMMQFKNESLHREIYKKLCEVKGENYEEPEPIQLHYSNFDNMSWQALEFLKMSDVEKAAAIEKEFPPKQYTEEESEELRRQFMVKINGMRERMSNNYTNS